MLTLLEKEEIKKLRLEGHTYSEITKIIGKLVPKSSLAYICRDITPPHFYYQKIKLMNKTNLESARRLALQANQQKYQSSIDTTRRSCKRYFSKLGTKEAKIALAMLYLGEGAKRSGFRGLSLGSSDPNIILTYLGLLNKCYGLVPSRFKCRVSYRADQNIEELTKFWSQITGISINNFYKTKPDPRTIGKPTKKTNYKGVCVVFVAGAQIQLELEIIADIINEAWGRSSAD